MEDRKPLLIQSGRQPFEIAILAACFLSGLVGVLTGSIPEAVSAILGDYSWTYNLSLALGALVTLIGVFMKPLASMLIERVGLIWLGMIFLAYALAVTFNPTGRGAAGAILLYGLSVAVVARVITITRDISKIELALAHPVLITDEPKLAEAVEGDADNV